MKMRELPDHLEVFVSDDDLDENWQLRDLDALMSRCAGTVSAIDAELAEALEDTQ